jgi:sodium transport system permease protein
MLEAGVRAALTIMRKEIAETMRDPLVLVISLGFPLLFFPLLFWGISQVSVLQAGIDDQAPPRVAVVGVASPGPGGVVTALLADPAIETQGERADLSTDALDLLVTVGGAGQALSVKLSHDSTRARSTRALSWAKEQLENVERTRMSELAASAGVDTSELEPWDIKYENVRVDSDRLNDLLSKVLPIFVFIALLMSIMAPAVDVFVGERERGTLETTLSAAVSRWSVLMGKTMAVVVIAMVAASGSMFAVGLTFLQMIASLTEESLTAPSVQGLQLLMMAPSVVAFATMMTAINFVLILPAQTFKQAQNMSSMVLIVGMLAVSVTVDMDPSTTGWQIWVPAVNVLNSVGLSLTGNLSLGTASLAFGTNGVLAVGCLAYVAHRMNDESFVFGHNGPGMWAKLVQRWRSRTGSSR